MVGFVKFHGWNIKNKTERFLCKRHGPSFFLRFSELFFQRKKCRSGSWCHGQSPRSQCMVNRSSLNRDHWLSDGRPILKWWKGILGSNSHRSSKCGRLRRNRRGGCTGCAPTVVPWVGTSRACRDGALMVKPRWGLHLWNQGYAAPLFCSPRGGNNRW
jgi:hypothetical protein